MTTPTYTSINNPETSEAAAIIDVAQAACEPTKISEDLAILLVTNQRTGTAEIIDAQPHVDQYQDRPRRKAGIARLTTGDSFGQYVERHADGPATALFADEVALHIVAVLNGHTESAGPDMAGWSDHRAQFTIRKTPAWQHWTARHNVLGSQSDFAEHIEARVIDIITPPGADMLELAQSFQATVKVDFESATRIGNGERRLVYKETIDSKAGQVGQLDIPETFTVRAAPFEGAAEVDIEARLRTKITNGQLVIGYALTRPEDIIREAFESVVQHVEEQTGYSIYRGTPPVA